MTSINRRFISGSSNDKHYNTDCTYLSTNVNNTNAAAVQTLAATRTTARPSVPAVKENVSTSADGPINVLMT